MTPEQLDLLSQELKNWLLKNGTTNGEHLRLAASVLADSSHGVIDTKDLRMYLRESLPEFMIPSTIRAVDKFPTTPNGKADRNQLARDDLHKNRIVLPERQTDVPSEIGQEEEKVLKIWRDVLGNSSIGIHDNFFEMGGDSILAIRLISRAAKEGVQLTVTELFSSPTVAGLVSQKSPAQSSDLTMEKDAENTTGAVPITPIQSWLLGQRGIWHDHWNQSVMLELNPALDKDDVLGVLKQIVEGHGAFRLSLQKTSSGWVQLALPYAKKMVQLPIHDVSRMNGVALDEYRIKIANELQRSMSLSAGCLLRAALLEGGDKTRHLILVVHHMAVDGISWNLLLEDLATQFSKALRGEPVELENRAIGFQQWAHALAQLSAEDALIGELPFWKDQDYHSSQDIPLDFDREEQNTEKSARTISVQLSKQETGNLLSLCRKSSFSLQELLISGFARALSDWMGSDKVLIGLEGHGREESLIPMNTTRTIGWFTSFFPVVIPIDRHSSMEQTINSVRKYFERLPNKGIGFGLLKYMGRSSSLLDSVPAPKVIFNYLGQQTEPEMGGMKLVKQGIGIDRHPESMRTCIFELNTFIKNDTLNLKWTYSRELHAEETVRRLVKSSIESVKQLLEKDVVLVQPSKDSSENADPGDAKQFLVPIQPKGSKTPLVLIHPMNGEIYDYLVLAKYLPLDQPIFAIRSPEVPFDDIETMGVAYLAELDNQFPDHNFVMGGYCFGSVISFEIARKMTQRGGPPKGLFIIDFMFPNLVRYRPNYLLKILGEESLGQLFRRSRNLGITLGKRLLRFSTNPSKGLGPEVQDFFDIPEEVPEEAQTRIATHFNSVKRYIPGTYSGDLNLILSNSAYARRDPYVGWDRLVRGKIDVVHIQRGHQEVIKEPGIKDVAEAISRIVDRL